MIVPHAGYIYSGAIAASAYATLRPIATHIHRVILLGPAHRVMVRGLALPASDAFDTPLGKVMLDTAAVNAITQMPQITINELAHSQEHSLEVQLPFLQSMLPDFTLLPLAVGTASSEEVAEVLDTLWGGDETLIVISSDLSHHLPYAIAQRVDGKHSLTPRLLDLRNSGDTAGSRDKVVGYAAIAFTEEKRYVN